MNIPRAMPADTRLETVYRVLRVYLRHPPMEGGMETHIGKLSAGQRALGLTVVNVFNSGLSTEDHVQIFKHFDLMRLAPAIVRRIAFYLGALLANHRLKDCRPTVLHIHGDWPDFLLSKLLARAVDASLVVASMHGSIRRLKPLLYGCAMSHCGLVLATGKREKDWLEKALEREVHHMPSAPADLFFEKYESKEPEWDVITVGVLRKQKRVDIFLDCAQRRPQWSFALIGDGPEVDDLRTKIETMHIRNVTMLGRLPQAQVAVQLRKARTFLSTSVEEGTPTAALEAMAVGLPVVLTPSNDYGWLVREGVEGIVLASWDPEAIVTALDQVLADEVRRKDMAALARLRANHHSWLANSQTVSALMGRALKEAERRK